MKPRFTIPGNTKRAGVEKPVINGAKKASRAELINVLKMAQGAMIGYTGMTAYDNATKKSRALKDRFTMDFTKELDAISKALRNAGAK